MDQHLAHTDATNRLERSANQARAIDRSMFVFKPDGINRHIEGLPRDFETITKGLFAALNLTIEEIHETRLDESQVLSIYPVLLDPSEYGDEWKYDLVDHLTSAEVRAYILSGEKADDKLRILKRHLRNSLTDRNETTSRVILNLLHVPDPHEFDEAYETIFLGANRDGMMLPIAE